MPEAGSSSRQRHLNREGSAYLSNYARTVNDRPHKIEKLAILAAIHAIPGNEAFTLSKLSNWFTRHRNSHCDTNTSILLDDETILFPKLTPTHLQQLRVLYKKVNCPTEGVTTFWAKRLNAEREEVAAWIEYQQEKAKESCSATESPDVSPTISEFLQPHLPTPAKSLSPHTRRLSLPPIAIKVEDPRQCLLPVPSLSLGLYTDCSVLESSTPLSRLPRDVQSAQTPVANALPRVIGQSHSNTMLAASIRESLLQRPDHSPPRTADEFAAKFEQVESTIDAFMKKKHTGQLAHLGWDSNN